NGTGSIALGQAAFREHGEPTAFGLSCRGVFEQRNASAAISATGNESSSEIQIALRVGHLRIIDRDRTRKTALLLSGRRLNIAGSLPGNQMVRHDHVHGVFGTSLRHVATGAVCSLGIWMTRRVYGRMAAHALFPIPLNCSRTTRDIVRVVARAAGQT